MRIGGLGSGLDFLYDENAEEVSVKKTLRVSEIEPNRDQPRKEFQEEAIEELADSIKQYGILQPILVRPMGLNYQIIAGERRWRAARMLGMDEVPVIIREFSDEEAMAVSLIENLQRENLNPIEEAEGYTQLIEQFEMTQDDVAKQVGKSRSTVTNAIRLMKLPDEILEMVKDARLSAGHARALLRIQDPQIQLEAAKRAADGKLSVRALEKIAADEAKAKESKSEKPSYRDSFYQEMQLSLENHLGRKVQVSYGKNKGTITLEFYDKDDLTALAQRIAGEDDF